MPSEREKEGRTGHEMVNILVRVDRLMNMKSLFCQAGGREQRAGM